MADVEYLLCALYVCMHVTTNIMLICAYVSKPDSGFDVLTFGLGGPESSAISVL